LLKQSKHPISASFSTRTTLLDLGFGCGDQTLYLTQVLLKPIPSLGNSDQLPLQRSALLDRYIGITLDPDQYKYTNKILTSRSLTNDPAIEIFCHDAANPTLWDDKLAAAVKGLSSPSSPEQEEVDCWVLALDTMYHFFPSRLPILTYARHELNASVMAFDLILSNNASHLSCLLLRLLAEMMGCPYDAFKTEREYRSLFVQAGYHPEKIELRDISEFVFAPLAQFLEDRKKTLEQFGWGLGKLNAARWLFGWWSRSGIIRGVIVVARK
jgi:hypothetical protein